MTGRERRDTLFLVVLAFAVSALSFRNGFTLDDRPIVADNLRVHSLVNLWHVFAETYWPPEVGAALYRPLTILLLTVQWALGHGAPWVFHLVNVALYVVTVILVFHLARRFLPSPVAWLTAALFAVHPVHVEPVAGVVGQPELLVALLVVAATIRYLDLRRAGFPDWRAVVGLSSIYLLACLSKEHGFMLPGFLLAAEMLLVSDSRPWNIRVRGLAPCAIALAVVAVLFVAVRSVVLGGLAGDIANASIRGVPFGGRALTMLGVVPHWVRLLAVPWHLQADYMPRELELATSFGPPQVVGLLFLLGAGLLCWWTWRKAPVVAFGLLWCGIGLFPVSNLLIPTGILLAERALFLPSVGALLVAGGLLQMVAPRLHTASLPERRVLIGALAALVLVGFVRSAVRHLVWRDNGTLFRQTVIDAPLSYKAHWAYAAQLFDAGDRAGAEQEYRLAIQLYPDDPNLYTDLGDRYLTGGFCGPAIPLYRESLRQAPEQWKVRSKLVICLLNQGDVGAAQVEATLKTKRPDPDAARIQAVVDSVVASRVANSPTSRAGTGPITPP